MVAWAQEYKNRADDYPGALTGFTPQLDAYQTAVRAYASAYLDTQVVSPALAFEAAAQAFVTSYATAASAWGTASAGIVLADEQAYAAWATCHAIGDNCDNNLPPLVQPGNPPLPNTSGLPQVPNTPAVPNPPLPPTPPSPPLPGSIPPPPSQ
jgi:hypothetical protein